jgi:hypothetical protein
LTSCYVTQSNAAKFAKKRLGEKRIEAVLQRLDRLTQDEARITTGEILKVVYGLTQNINEVINGKQMRLDLPMIYSASSSPEGNPSVDSIREALGTFSGNPT